MNLEAAIALNRLGLGARPGEGEDLGDPLAWVRDQLRAPAPLPAELARLPGSADILRELPPGRFEGRPMEFAQTYRPALIRGLGARLAHAVTTDAPVFERLVQFWSNHFAIAVTNPRTLPWPLSYEREAIRPHVLGRFSDMLLAVVRHPGMLTYLDNAQSIGPGSPAGRISGRGLNENLAREILELHTVGVTAGYTQADVTDLARILTGWSVERGDAVSGSDGFRFFPRRHEPGTKTVLGRSYGEGYEEGVRALRDLAERPETAARVAARLAVHLVADEPAPAVVDRLAAVFRETRGDLRAVTLAALDEPQTWAARQTKLRPPVEYVTACMRALTPRGAPAPEPAVRERLLQSLRLLGQTPFGAPSPQGWPDTAAAWSGPDALLERIEWAHALAARVGAAARDPLALGRAVLGPLLSETTRIAIARAESPVQGLALLLASPEVQRR